MIETPTVKMSCAPSAAQRVVDEAERGRPDQRPDRHQDDHLRHAQERRDRPGAEPGAEDQPEVAQDLLYIHRQRATLLRRPGAPGERRPGPLASIPRTLALFMLFGSAPLLLVVTPARDGLPVVPRAAAPPVAAQVKLAWLLFVFLTHAFGFLALLAYLHLYARREPS